MRGWEYLEALPGERAAQEVHEHEAEALHVVSPRLLDALVRRDAGVARRAREVLALDVWYMATIARVLELLRKTKVNHVTNVLSRAGAD